MADNLMNKKQIEQALAYYHEALQVSLLIKAKSEEYNLYWKMYKVFEFNNQKDSSYYYLKKYTEVKMSIENEEKTKEFLRQESKYQIDKRVAEEAIKMEQQNLIIAEKNKWKNYVLIGVVFIALILIYLVAMSIKRMKIIAAKNEIINSINSALTVQNKEILDSINYAKRIQNAILPPQRLIKELLPESFVLYLPKDIVAGDFYWMESLSAVNSRQSSVHSPQSSVHRLLETENCGLILFAAADCTGHGVPGAMVSVICNNGLNRSVREYGMTDPAQILEKTREIVIQEFEKSDEEVKDGMDIALCSLSSVSSSSGAYRELQYAGANNPLWIIRLVRHSALDAESVNEIAGQARNDGNFELIEIKPTKQHIGKVDQQKPFVTHTVELQKGDSIYIFTDGYQDQFGGEKGKKFKAAKLKTLLLSIQDKVMEEQKIIINQTFESWKGTLEQVDDVCIIGVRI
jgi:serine phosphatase RsbU (regulator of sigma subunit)